MTAAMLQSIWESPIKGLVKRKNTSPLKIIIFFPIDAYIRTAGIRFRLLSRTRYFFIIGSRSAYTDPHQSPIGIKAICDLSSA